MPLGVLHQRLGRVEAHRLGVQQRRAERGRVVQLQPGRGVDQEGEADRMALGEAEGRERLDLGEDVVGDRAGDAVGGHALIQPVAQPGHLLLAALGAHRPAHLVGLGRAAAGRVDGQPHQLLLEQRHAQGALQRRLQQRVRVGDRLQAVLAAQVRMHRVALDRAGPDQRDLDDQVVEGARLEPGQGGHLGPGLDLEHPDGVGGAQHVVHPGVLGRDLVQAVAVPVPGLDEVEAVLQRREHSQAQQVELHQAGGRAVVLVPLQHRPAGHPAPLHRAHLDDRTVADHHAAGVDAEVARGVLQLLGQGQHLLGYRVLFRRSVASAGCRPRLPAGRAARSSGSPAACSRRPAGRWRSPAPWRCRGPPSVAGR